MTLAQIAEICEVSRVTVSKALRNDPKISSATKKRVKAAAKKLGYVRDTRLSELMTYLGSERRLSGVHEEIPYLYCGNYYNNTIAQPRFFQAANKVAEDQGFRLKPYHLTKTNCAALEREFRARSIRGLMFAPFSTDDSLPEMHWERYAMLGFGLSLPEIKIRRIDWNYRIAVRSALERMREKGYKRVGVLASSGYSDGLNYSIEAEALRDYHSQSEANGVEPLINDGIRQDDTGEAVISEWIERERPDAILCTEANYERILRLGLDREGMGFASWWNSSEHEGISMPGMRGDVSMLADLGTKMLVGMIHSRDRGLEPNRILTLVDMVWHE